jgi:hypothetical protein
VKSATLVMVDGELVQTSLAPMRIVTYAACCATAACAWPSASIIFAPAPASL